MGRNYTGPQDINTRRLIRRLENTKINIWKEIATILKHPRRARPETNLSHINRVVNDGDVIVVPGKVLGAGDLSKRIIIGALSWSESVTTKTSNAGVKLLSLPQMLDEYPTGANVRLIK